MARIGLERGIDLQPPVSSVNAAGEKTLIGVSEEGTHGERADGVDAELIYVTVARLAHFCGCRGRTVVSSCFGAVV